MLAIETGKDIVKYHDSKGIDKTAVTLRDEARKYYGQMQHSWFMFAKIVKKIRDEKFYKLLEKKSFKDFCKDEYPTMNYVVIVKTISVVENWGKELESKIDTDPLYKLPAYESCYRLTTIEKKLPKEEFIVLKNNVLNGMGFHTLRSKINNIVEKKLGLKKSSDEIETELVEDIKDEIDDFDEEKEKNTDVIDIMLVNLHVRVEYLNENMDSLSNFLESSPDSVGDEVINFAHDLEFLQEKISQFLNKLESLTK